MLILSDLEHCCALFGGFEVGPVTAARPIGSSLISGLYPAYPYTLGPSTNPNGSGCVYLPAIGS